jgi:hypothetical protein
MDLRTKLIIVLSFVLLLSLASIFYSYGSAMGMVVVIMLMVFFTLVFALKIIFHR